jgi:hypothetical protein
VPRPVLRLCAASPPSALAPAAARPGRAARAAAEITDLRRALTRHLRECLPCRSEAGGGPASPCTTGFLLAAQIRDLTELEAVRGTAAAARNVR